MDHRKSRLMVAIIITTFVILSSTLSFAAPMIFKDIDGHWAKGFIEDIYSKKLTSGYPDATFKPDGNITKLETIVIISKLMGFTDQDEKYYIDQYKQTMEKQGIPGWAQGAASYALFNDILLENEVTGLVSGNNNVNAKRYEVATYIGRVLEHSIDEEMNKIFITPYKDEMSIPSIALPYIDLLLNKDILDETSNEGRFLPHNLITRAEVAKLISMSAEILDDVSTKPNKPPTEPNKPPTTPEKPPTTTVMKTVNGYIDNIIFGDKNVVSIVTGNTKQIYDIHSKVDVTIDGNNANIKDLEIGQIITANVEDNVIMEITAMIDEETVDAYFYYYISGIRPMIYIKDQRGTVSNFDFTDSSRVYLMDREVDITDLKDGDLVTIKYKDNKVIEIDAEEKEHSFKGKVISKDANRDEYSLEVSLDDGNLKIFNITSDATLRRDRRSIKFDEIKLGDEVEITTEYETVTYVSAYSVRRNVKGYIKKIDIGDNIQLKVETYDGDVEDFILTPNTTIKIEEIRAGVYDLRLNYEVELELENNEVIWMDAYKTSQGLSYKGKLTYRDSRNDTMELQITNREEVVIHVDEKTIYIDEYGKTIGYRDVNIGDEIIVIAENNGYYITAQRVLVMIRR